MLEQLLRDLNSRKQPVREAAIAQARRLPPEQLLQLINLEAQQSKLRNKVISNAFTVAVILGMLYYGFELEGTFWPFLFCWPILFLFDVSRLRYMTRARRALIEIVETTEDPRFVGPALELLAEHGVTDASVRSSLVKALKCLLPRLRADQADLLTPDQKEALRENLFINRRDIDFSVCLLKALEQVGEDARAIHTVKMIVTNSAGSWCPSVVKAAEECLPPLQARIQQKQQTETLLRASDAIPIRPDTLLRPADASASDTPPEQLLRASDASPVIMTNALKRVTVTENRQKKQQNAEQRIYVGIAGETPPDIKQPDISQAVNEGNGAMG